MEDKENKSPLSRKDTELFIAGLQLAVCFLLCAGIGRWLDIRYGTGHRYTEWGVWIGLAAGICNFVKAIIGALSDKE